MGYAENHQKFVAVLNRRHPLPRQFNAAGHATAGLAAEIGREGVDILSYPNIATGFRAHISRFPFIILEAKNSGQLERLRSEAQAGQVAHNVFTATMIGASAQDQQAVTRDAAADDLDYICIVLFGPAEHLDPLTRRFSLVREASGSRPNA